MLSSTDRPIEDVIRALSMRGVAAAYLVPTETGLKKSILDAHGSLREYLREKGIHDFSFQQQGGAHRKIAAGHLVTPEQTLPTKVSLYRPETKTGDPRIWITGLPSVASSRNLVAILAHEGALYVANVSDRRLLSDELEPRGELKSLLDKIVESETATANELLARLRAVSAEGWIKSLRAGPTGIGFTLESKLGIAANSSRTPDYKGIEIKAGRGGARALVRTTLFSKTPDWNRSAVHNGLQLLDRFGYLDVTTGRKQLYCSLSHIPNSKGHYLALSEEDTVLHSMYRAGSSGNPPEKVLYWGMDVLKASLAAKHQETFWVSARARRNGDGEQFKYGPVLHTRAPLLENLPELFRLGKIELDYLLHEVKDATGARRARDHGYLFKMWKRNLIDLFPPPVKYEL